MRVQKGTKLRCISAKELGIPIVEGEIYTAKRRISSREACEREGDGLIEERKHIPGVTLMEVPGYFMLTRFELVEENDNAQ